MTSGDQRQPCDISTRGQYTYSLDRGRVQDQGWNLTIRRLKHLQERVLRGSILGAEHR